MLGFSSNSSQNQNDSDIKIVISQMTSLILYGFKDDTDNDSNCYVHCRYGHYQTRLYRCTGCTDVQVVQYIDLELDTDNYKVYIAVTTAVTDTWTDRQTQRREV